MTNNIDKTIQHPLNIELSRKVYDTCEHLITTKECYVNVFHTVSYFADKFRTGEWKVAYGYIRILDGQDLMARHCFIINEQNEAIDPTLLCLSSFSENIDKSHTSFYIFENIGKYFQAVEHNNFTPDLIKPLLKLEKETSDIWAEKNGYTLIR